MLILRGAPALSSFRAQKLLTNLQQRVPAVTGVSSEFVHFANVAAPLSDDQQQVLQQLLFGAVGSCRGLAVLVFSRHPPWGGVVC